VVVAPAEEDPDPAVDVSACTLDMLSNLSSCASALHNHASIPPHVPDTGQAELPDLSTLAETLSRTRELASQALGHWVAKTEKVRDCLERAREELGMTERQLEQLAKELGWPAGVGESLGAGAVIVEGSQRKGNLGPTAREGDDGAWAEHVSEHRDPDSSRQSTSSNASAFDIHTNIYTTGHLASAAMNEQEPTGRAGHASMNARMENEGPQEVIRQEEQTEMGELRNEERMAEDDYLNRLAKMVKGEEPDKASPKRTLQYARVLQRAGKDLQGIVGQLALARRSHILARECVKQARSGVKTLIQVCSVSLSTSLQMLIPLFILVSPGGAGFSGSPSL